MINKKILVVLTGGTICSQYEGNVKVQGGSAGTELTQSFLNSDSPFAGSVSFGETENYGLFSENMTIKKWNMLTSRFRTLPEIRDTAAAKGAYPSLAGERISSNGNVFDGIIIAHGTDTLAYSAALFSLYFKNAGVPVFLVSSNEALSSEKANGKENFRAAVECICRGIMPNVYVTYKNPTDGRMYLHTASRLKQCGSYSADFFSSGMLDITDLNAENANEYFGKLPVSSAGGFDIDFFSEEFSLDASIIKIVPYVGLDYDCFNLSGADAVLHLTYHSGTVCSEKTKQTAAYSENSILHLLDKYPHLPVYIAPCDLSGGIYETVPVIAEHERGCVYFVNGCTDEMLYVKLLVAYSMKLPQEEIISFLKTELNCETVCEELTVVKK